MAFTAHKDGQPTTDSVFPPIEVKSVPFDRLDPVEDVQYWGESIRAILNVLGELRGAPVLLPHPLIFAEKEEDLQHFNDVLRPLTQFLTQHPGNSLLGKESLQAIDEHVRSELRAIEALEVLDKAVRRRNRKALSEITLQELTGIRSGLLAARGFLETLRDRIVPYGQVPPFRHPPGRDTNIPLVFEETPVGLTHYLVEIQAHVIALIETVIENLRHLASTPTRPRPITPAPEAPARDASI